jgi:hypothetical protein
MVDPRYPDAREEWMARPQIWRATLAIKCALSDGGRFTSAETSLQFGPALTEKKI